VRKIHKAPALKSAGGIIKTESREQLSVLIPDVGGIIKLNGPKFKIKELFSDYKARV
jgi:hypothetical protein